MIFNLLKFLALFGIGIVAIMVGLFLALTIASLGKLQQKKDAAGKVRNNSIALKVKISVNGIEQGMFIVGENQANPILLFLHGGPGSPEYMYFSKRFEALEKIFTICYWDQRGAGMSYHFKDQAVTLENLIADTKVVSEYLIKTFAQAKIYLLGHSWGTFLGIKTIEKYPELFKAYIGVGQVSDQLESERLAYQYFMLRSRENNEQKTIAALSKYHVDNEEFALEMAYILKLRNRLLNKYGIGVTHQKLDNKKMVKDSIFFKGYTSIEKIKCVLGVFKSMKTLWASVIKNNLIKDAVIFDIPIYILHGAFDYQVSYQLAQNYFERIESPKKAFFTFETSAHCPFYEEEAKFFEIMEKIKLRSEEK